MAKRARSWKRRTQPSRNLRGAGKQVLCGAYRRQPRSEGNCAAKRPGGMEAGGRLPHRTNSEPSIGSTRLGSASSSTRSPIFGCAGSGRGGGSGRTSFSLNPGDLHGSAHGRSSGAGGNNSAAKPMKKSDHLVVARKSRKRDGAKGMTGCKASDSDNWNWRWPRTRRKANP